MKRVLVTGGSGFIGRHLVASQLRQGHFVRAVDLHEGAAAGKPVSPNLEEVIGDIADPAVQNRIVEGIDVVYHLASAHLDVRLSADDYRRVNVDATAALILAAKAAGVQRFVHCSSVGVMGDVQTPPADETAPCLPENIYEVTKFEGEKAAAGIARQTGFPVVIVRPAWVFGPGCPRTEKLFRMVRKGRFIFFGQGRNFRHPIYIDDAIRGMEQCAGADLAPGECFILAGHKPATTRELVDAIAQTANVKSPAIHVPIIFGRLAGAGLEIVFKAAGRTPPFSSRSMDFYVKNNAYSIRKAKQAFGFDPQFDLLHGLAETWKRMQANR